MAAKSFRLLLLMCALSLGVDAYGERSTGALIPTRRRHRSHVSGRERTSSSLVSREIAQGVLGHSSTARVLPMDVSQLEGPSYRLLGKPLPALPFKPGDQGNFNVKEGSVSQQLINRMTDAAEHAHEKLVQARKEELSRTDVISALEPVLPEEFGRGECITGGPCEAGWKDVGERQASVVYLSSLVDLSKYKRKVYIDGGANSYDSSIGGWFLRSYPQASLDFQIYAFEVDQRYKKTYVDTGVEFIRYALWTHNTTLHAGPMNSILLGSKGRKDRAIIDMPTLDFVEWLVRSVTPEDFVVLKLDIEGAEFEVVQEMVRTRAVHLIDELFVECHYDKWSRMRPDKTRQDCVDFIMSLRSQGVVAHDWF